MEVPAASRVSPMTASGIMTQTPNSVAIHTMLIEKVSTQNFSKMGRRQSGMVRNMASESG